MNHRKDIILVIAPPFGPEGPPMGLACLAAHLKGNGLSVGVMDANVRLFRDSNEGDANWWSPDSKARWVYPSAIGDTYARFAQHLDSYVEELAQEDAPLYGFSVHSDNRLCTKEIILRLKQLRPEAKIIVGGMGVSSQSERRALGKGLVDYYVVGEGETSLLELIKSIEADEDPAEIPGVMAWRDGAYTKLTPRPWAKHLNDFYFPTFEEFDLTKYSTPNLPVLTSRGCTKGCVICNDRVLMGKYRKKDTTHIFDEIMHHIKALGIRDFMFNDLQINNNLDQIDAFCSEIIAAGEEIRFNANAIVDDNITPDLLKNLAAAGCHTLCLGLESGSPKVIKGMNKAFKIEQAERLMKDIKEAGITLWVNIVIGFPSETEEDFQQTLDFFKAHAEQIDAVAVLNTCNILDHSILADKLEKYGIAEPVDPDWFEVNWETLDGQNTPAIRLDRQRRFIELVESLGVEIRQTNYRFEDEDSHKAKQSHDLLMVLAPPFDVQMPPWELARAASYLERKGLSVFGLDLNIELYKRSAEENRPLWELARHDAWADETTFEEYAQRLGLDFDRIAKRICSINAPRIYFHAQRGNLPFLSRIAKRIREIDPEIKLIYGGPSTKIDAERQLLTDEIADFFIQGEIEPSLEELVSRLSEGRSLEFIRGVMYTLPDGNKHILPREPVKNLDDIGYSTYEQFKPDRYLSPKLPITTSRGCRYRCAFCSEQPEQGPFRHRSAEQVFEEMVTLYETWDVFTFEFKDLVIDGDLEMLGELCDLIIDSKMPFLWSGPIAPRADLSVSLFDKMKAAGCTSLTFGVESFSDTVLKAMNKTYTAAQAIQNLRDASGAGIEVHIALIIGFPNQTDEEFYTTAMAIRDNVSVIDYVDTITACYVSPNSLLERNPQKLQVYLPPGQHYQNWHQHGKNNKSWRNTRVKELAVYVAGLPVKFNYDFFVPPTSDLRKMEDRIRKRFERRMRPKTQVLLSTMPPWGYENPPVALAYLATYLRSNGVSVEVIDNNIDFYNGVFDIYKMLWHVENKNYWSNEKTFEVVKYSLNNFIHEAVQKIATINAPVCGFSVVDPKERITIEMVKRLRAVGYSGKIILGGPACHTPDYRQIFIDQAGDLIDGYCLGEGEQTLLEAVQRVQQGQDLSDVPGLMTMDENKECVYEPRPFIEDLDSIPFPTYEDFDFSLYPGDSLILEWSRGCIGSCTFCKGKQIAGHHRSRSAKHIFEELRYHYEQNGYDNFTICDPVINGAPEVLDKLCDMVVDYKLPVRWNGEGIPRKGLTAPLLGKMKAAGCYELQLGVETGSPNTLKRMGKARLFNHDEAQKVVRDCHEAGIKTCIFIIIGFPGETEDDFKMTLDFIDRNAKWIDQVKSINSCHIITDTPIHKNADKFGIILPERDYHYLWTDENGMDWPERNKRIRRVLAVCKKHDIEVRETNLTEGKQIDLAEEIGSGKLSIDQQMDRMIKQINNLGSFEVGDVEAECNLPGAPVSRPVVEKPEPVEESEIEPEEKAEPRFGSEEEKEAFIKDNRQLAGVLDGEKVFAGPELLEIDLTNACNLNCAGCWNHSLMLGDDRYSGEMFRRRLPTRMLLDAIDKAADMGAKRVQLSGAGEPFMHPDLMQIIEKIKSRGLSCALISNFTLVDEKKAKALVDLGVDDLTVSVWAGTPKMYEKTHPGTKGKTLKKIQNTLRYIHKLKAEKKVNRPHVKIYNVISKLNAEGITDMVNFAIDSLADFIEFTPIDVIPGKTDQLALDDEARSIIARQLDEFPKRSDYLELDPTQGARGEGETESKEFARFIKTDLLDDFFKYELDDISRFDVLCPRKEWRLDVQEDNTEENALLFYYPKSECEQCPMAHKCPIDKERYAVKVEFLSFMGFGAFYRRITSPSASKGEYDQVVRDLPCLVGWTYARLLTSGEIIPCCKADDMPLGNLHEKGFEEIWKDAPYCEFRVKAKNVPKDDPFFAPIDCLAACDNLGQNLGTIEKLEKLSDEEKDALKH